MVRAISGEGENGQAEVSLLQIVRSSLQPDVRIGALLLRQNQLVLLGAAKPVDLTFELYPNLVSTNDQVLESNDLWKRYSTLRSG